MRWISLMGGPIATTIKIAEGRPFEILGDIRSPKPKTAPDPNFIVDGKPLETKYFEDQCGIRTDRVKGKEQCSAESIAFDVRYPAL